MSDQPENPRERASLGQRKLLAASEPELAELISTWYREARAEALARSRVRRFPCSAPTRSHGDELTS